MIIFLLFVIACGMIYFVLKDISRRRTEKDYIYTQNLKKERMDDAQRAFLEIMGPNDKGAIDFNERIKTGLSANDAMQGLFLGRMQSLIRNMKTFGEAHKLVELFKRAGVKYEKAAELAKDLEGQVNKAVEATFIAKSDHKSLEEYKKACKDQESLEIIDNLLIHKFDE